MAAGEKTKAQIKSPADEIATANGAILGEFEVAEDMMLNGLKIVQDKRLYRFTSDSVLLSKFVTPKKGERIADFCAGSGIVGFHFYALNRERLKGAPILLVELQTPLAQLSKKTIALNGFENFAVENCPLQKLPKKYNEYFSLILCNPPYEKGGFENETYEKAICRKEITLTLEEIAVASSRALKFGGRLALVHRADRVAEVICALKAVNLETKRLQFVSGKEGAKPYLVLIEAVKGGKPACEVLPTIIN